MNAPHGSIPSLSVVASRGTMSFFQKLPGLARVSEDALEELSGLVDVKRMRRGQALWRVGQPAGQVFWVRSGVVWIHQGADRDVSVGYYGRGSMVGMEPGGAGAFRQDECEVHEDVIALVIDRTALDRWLFAHPEAVSGILDAMAEACRRMQARLALLGLPGAKARLAGLLLDLATRFGIKDSRGVIIDLRLTHREMAALIGATRETVSVTIVEMRTAGVIRTDQRRVIVMDEHRLTGLAAFGRAA